MELPVHRKRDRDGCREKGPVDVSMEELREEDIVGPQAKIKVSRSESKRVTMERYRL